MSSQPDDRISASDRELFTTWAQGWALSRGARSTSIPGGIRIDVNRPGQRVCYVLQNPEPAAVKEFGTSVTAPGIWIKIPGESDVIRSALPGWRILPQGNLMTKDLAVGTQALEPPYRLKIATRDAVTVAAVLDESGAVVASAKFASLGRFAIIDQVSTDPAHRRRGFARLVLQALANRALDLDVTKGLVVGTEAGRSLYTALGWTWRFTVSGGYLKEPLTE